MKPVLVIEDQLIVSDALKMVFDLVFPDYPLRVVHTRDQALAALQESHDWSLILLDLQIPGATGLSFAEEIRQLGLAGRCAIHSGTYREDYTPTLKEWGFLGYIPKNDVPLDQMGNVLAKLVAGQQLWLQADPALVAQPRATLTTRQLQVVRQLAVRRSTDEIAAKLGISKGRVNNMIETIKVELGADNRTAIVVKALQQNLIFLQELEA